MKKIIMVIICIVVAVVFFVCGFFLGKNSTEKEVATEETNTQEKVSKEKQLVGLYYCDNWNGNSRAQLELFEDGTLKYPIRILDTDKGTWNVEGDVIKVVLDVDKTSDMWKAYQEMNYDPSQPEIRIINEGLLVGSNIFRKLN